MSWGEVLDTVGSVLVSPDVAITGNVITSTGGSEVVSIWPHDTPASCGHVLRHIPSLWSATNTTASCSRNSRNIALNLWVGETVSLSCSFSFMYYAVSLLWLRINYWENEYTHTERWSIHWKTTTIAKPKATDQEERANLLSLFSVMYSAEFLFSV